MSTKSGSLNHGTFIGEPITPKSGTFDIAVMATGAPGPPSQFTWRKIEYTAAEVLESWKTIGPCKSSSKAQDMYVRKHFYKIRTTTGEVMNIYCDRQPPRGRSKIKRRWTLYTIEQAETLREDKG